MAVVYPNDTPIEYMNIKQLRRIARLNQIPYTALTTKAQLIALIQAE
jgi:hypothetical protein